MVPFVILVYGLPGSGKTTLANKISQKVSATHLNADIVRKKYSDWDFSEEGRQRQVERMLTLSKGAKTQFVVLDFVCPYENSRQKIKPNLTIFLDTISESRFENTNRIFEKPTKFMPNFHFKEKNSDEQSDLIAKALISFDWKKPTVQMLGRWQPFHDGHLELFKRAIAKTGQVVIQIRDCQNWQGSNPFSFEETKYTIINKLSEFNYIEGRDYVIQLVPNVVNITYGRDVGYLIEQETFRKSIELISGTKIRKAMGLR